MHLCEWKYFYDKTPKSYNIAINKFRVSVTFYSNCVNCNCGDWPTLPETDEISTVDSYMAQIQLKISSLTSVVCGHT